ncbi:ABC transporter ATP-binding protein [Gloeobacter kilaueensis]|uniref:ABC transporter n=1 Tax=Gloeobacter kilaueensis (strain ATCC BAA-2537 / CCAP 1431/1 / ULC 316 / JS1) TaxID=1183438 RepID=U5QL53_GLOK1|nr:ABC transporter ATP-binding protein [Gloeobacter kilaueensis]AGY59666.1 ABC transporter [Gloeobacter kilaueensis JS1]
MPSEDLSSETGAIALDIQNLSKSFRSGFWLNRRLYPLKNCTLQVPVGETFGLLGPNGAGKTTLLKILLGIVRPGGGKATLLGCPLGDESVKSRIGYLPENPYFYDALTGEEVLYFAGRLFELPRHLLKQRVDALLDRVGLSRLAGRRPLRKYSKGMLQRLGLAQALINDPQLLFLDEPMSGLDPLGRHRFREILLQLRAEGRTIFFNSHILTDVELLCDRIGLLIGGELVRQGSLTELLGSKHTYRAELEGKDPRALEPLLADLDCQGNRIRGRLKLPPREFVAALPPEAVLIELRGERPSLEDFFQATVAAHQGQLLDT